MGKDERAAFHFPFSRDQAIFRIMCLVTGSTSSPGITGVMGEELGLCGFIHIAGAFFFSFFFFPLFVTQGGSVGTSGTACFCSCLRSVPKWHHGVHVSVTNFEKADAQSEMGGLLLRLWVSSQSLCPAQHQSAPSTKRDGKGEVLVPFKCHSTVTPKQVLTPA